MVTASHNGNGKRIVIDSIHGDIKLTDQEWKIVSTATFQRLRSLKQLGMGHLVYPNATHTRFAHSLGVLKIMSRIVDLLEKREIDEGREIDPDQSANLRMAALLHDVGHYPYSHLMERVDHVQLTEEIVAANSVAGDGTERKDKRTLERSKLPYPDHESLGRLIITSQQDILEAIGSSDRATEIGAIFSRTEAANPQLSKLIHSSLDMDRLDYLLRDARAAGVPYGEIDLNYILNNIRISTSGVIGVDFKAMAAAEHFLMARLFMHRVVYYHKTTYGLEEACRQLLKRMRGSGRYDDDMPVDGEAINTMCAGKGLAKFTDGYVDLLIQKAEADPDLVISTLAKCIVNRRPPRLLVETSGFIEKDYQYNQVSHFRARCIERLPATAKKFGIELGLFLLGGPKPIKLEERGAMLTTNEARKLQAEEREELIKVFERDAIEPTSIVELSDSLMRHLSGRHYAIYRIYLADSTPDGHPKFDEIRREIRTWLT